MRALISGFEPIWGIKKTPSCELARAWQSKEMPVPEGTEVKAVILPQQFGVCTEIMCGEIASFKPHVVIMYGATPKNDPVRIERFAINCEMSPMGDNTRIPVKDRPVVAGGPSAYEPSLPVHYLVSKLQENGVPSKASMHAGTHVCNSMLYGVMHWLATNPMPHKVAAGFVHVAFPNSFGVIEDELWDTAQWPHLVRASTILLAELIAWRSSQFKE